MEAMAKHRTYSTEFKRQVAQEYIAGGDFLGVLRAQLRPERVGTRPVRHLGTPPTLV